VKILASTNMPQVEDAFAAFGEVEIKDGRSIAPADVKDADILVTRSTTRLDSELLQGSSVKFVGTATIGIDHVDCEYLEDRALPWAYAPGCNANSVAEYVVGAILELRARGNLGLDRLTVGIVGVGNVGSLVAEKMAALGLDVLLCDPPRERRSGMSASLPWKSLVAADGLDTSGPGAEGSAPAFVPLDQLLAEADIVTLHIPLIPNGIDATYRLADAAFFHRMKAGAAFINTSRGGVVDPAALDAWIQAAALGPVVIDTWEGEPTIDAALVARADLATPHIAGYSHDGRLRGTEALYRAACHVFDRPPEWKPSMDGAHHTPADTQLLDAVRLAYDIRDDDAALREQIEQFDELRRTYRMRREFRCWTISKSVDPDFQRQAIRLGFRVSAA